ncbi:AAA family ATPase [Sorangium sp. So ce1097]|uniref:AAA family ATPase n=1 Tax=Sorangium sp. So ce1097 TaxID=3133330 RepID=UPI003F5E0796
MVSAPAQTSASLRLALARVRLLARRRATWLRSLWDRERRGPARDGAPLVTHAEADAWLEGWDDELEERRWAEADEAMRAARDGLVQIEQALAAPGSRLARLEQVFGLTQRELDYVQACLAVTLDPSLARVFAYLHDNAARAYPTEILCARLFGHGVSRVLTPESPLSRWALVHEEHVAAGDPPVLALDPLVRDWLVGDDRLDGALLGVARLHAPLPPLPRWPVEEQAEAIRRMVSMRDGRVRLRVTGPPGSGRRTFAASVAARLELPLLVVDADAVSDEQWPLVFQRAQRQAFLDGSALAWIGDCALRRRWPDLTPPFPVQFLIAEVGEPPAAVPGATDTTVEIPTPSVAERAALWRQHVAGAAAWPEAELSALAAHHRATAGEIAAIGARPLSGPAEAAQLVCEVTRHRLGDLARWIECPFTWDDLVLPESLRVALEDMLFESRERAAFWEDAAARRLFPQGRGLFALFSGPPGTGKTMAAQVIAASLRLDLFRISLSTVVSKYVGETAKNLQRILARAEAMDAVLLFDEADALFGKRTEIKDAHDRFANTDTNHLLQAIEAYRGIAILASNKKTNIDPAFTRRLRYVLEFPRPDAGQRRKLWGRLVGELAGADRAAALARELDALATSVEATGAQIKYAVLSALFASRQDGRPLAIAHLLRGVERELLKEGRALNDRDRERLAAHG